MLHDDSVDMYTIGLRIEEIHSEETLLKEDTLKALYNDLSPQAHAALQNIELAVNEHAVESISNISGRFAHMPDECRSMLKSRCANHYYSNGLIRQSD